MKTLGLRLFRKKHVQTSALTALTASASVPGSGFAFMANSQGASGALVEFTKAVSAALDFIDLEDDSEDGPFQAQLSKLEEAVGGYSNSNVELCRGLTDWTTTKATTILVDVAFQCAATVYDGEPKAKGTTTADLENNFTLQGHRDPKAAGITFTEIDYAKPSFGGTAKAIGAWKVESEVLASTNDHLPAVIIAIRGTSSQLDHLVNINSRPVSVKEFFHSDEHGFLKKLDDISAHSGFLSGAKALLPRVMSVISKAQSLGIEHVVLTGHSAGGAVANLTFLKLLLAVEDSAPSLKFSCITFGAPPTLNIDITTALRTEPRLSTQYGLNLAFVNEFDLVPRTDQTYVRSLIDLYRSVYGLAPLMVDIIREDDKDVEGESYVLPPLEFDDQKHGKAESSTGLERAWLVPHAEYSIVGDLVLLRNVRVEKHADQTLLAQTIIRSEYQNLVYGSIKTHSRTHYGYRVNLLQQGKFNHEVSW